MRFYLLQFFLKINQVAHLNWKGENPDRHSWLSLDHTNPPIKTRTTDMALTRKTQ
jgi:hypothetical protein